MYVLQLIHENDELCPMASSRLLLRAAVQSIEAIDGSEMGRRALVAAGCELREALTWFLFGLSARFDCWPQRKSNLKPLGLVQRLHSCGHVSKWVMQRASACLDDCNRLAHCHLVPKSRLELGRDLLSWMLREVDHLDAAALATATEPDCDWLRREANNHAGQCVAAAEPTCRGSREFFAAHVAARTA